MENEPILPATWPQGGSKEVEGHKRLRTAENARPTAFKNLAERLQFELPCPKGQKVIVKKISDVNFRANWMSPQTKNDTGDLSVRTWKIVASQFLKVTVDGNDLLIENKTTKPKFDAV